MDEPSAVCGLLPASNPPAARGAGEGLCKAGHQAHLPAEVVQLQQRLQVCALPLSRHVEVGQLGLEGPLRGREGGQLRALRSSCRSGRGPQLSCPLGQFQATAVLGLSGTGQVPIQVPS